MSRIGNRFCRSCAQMLPRHACNKVCVRIFRRKIQLVNLKMTNLKSDMCMMNPKSAYVSDSIAVILLGSAGRPSMVNKNSLVSHGLVPKSSHANSASAGLTYNMMDANTKANSLGINLTTSSVFGLYFLCFVYLFLTVITRIQAD